MFYRWQSELFNSGNLIFENIKPDNIHSSYQKQIQKLENKLAKKNEVLVELMEEHVKLKKALHQNLRVKQSELVQFS